MPLWPLPGGPCRATWRRRAGRRCRSRSARQVRQFSRRDRRSGLVEPKTRAFDLPGTHGTASDLGDALQSASGNVMKKHGIGSRKGFLTAIPAKGPTFAEGASRQHRCQRASRRDPPRPAWRRHCLDYSVSPEEPAPAYPVTTMVVGIPTACPNAIIKRFPVLQEVVEEQTPHLFPEVAGTPGFHLRLPACNIAVEQERQHQRKDGRQVFLAVTEVVLKAVALVLQGIESFVLDLPARPSGAHQLPLLVDWQIRNPALFLAVWAFLPVFKKIDFESAYRSEGPRTGIRAVYRSHP